MGKMGGEGIGREGEGEASEQHSVVPNYGQRNRREGHHVITFGSQHIKFVAMHNPS